MHAGDAATTEEDIPHFSEEEETMSQTGRDMTDEEMRAMGLTPPKDEVDEVDEEVTEEVESEEGDDDPEQYFQKYGVMKPPPCPKPMPMQGGRTTQRPNEPAAPPPQRPPEPPGPPPGYMAPATKPSSGLKPAASKPGPKRVLKPQPAAQVPKPAAAVPKAAGAGSKPAAPVVVPPPTAGVTVQWTKAVCTQTTVLPPPPPPAAVESKSSSSSSRPSEAVVPYEDEGDYELGGDPDPKGMAMVKWKQQLGFYIFYIFIYLNNDIYRHCMTNQVIYRTCQGIRQ